MWAEYGRIPRSYTLFLSFHFSQGSARVLPEAFFSQITRSHRPGADVADGLYGRRSASLALGIFVWDVLALWDGPILLEMRR